MEVKGPEEEKDPVKELPPTVTKKSGEKRRSRGVKLGSSDSDEGTAPPTTRRLPATLQEPKAVDKEKDLSVEIPAAQNPRKEKEKGASGKTQSCCDNPPEVVIKNPISAEKSSDASGSTETPKTNPPLDFNNYMDVLAAVFGEPDMSLENVDILEIAAMRGIHIEPPRWHRPGGYGPKPKDSKK
ncbi:uncharacterized protein A4U43_C10F6360 [Asparagus officinalis]|uniref:Uncharacterized protein n=1 Tax=Asparagus officinalis TaxID=4686 RepID=A0A5P1E130_ASPOF|nr:uncharacterized protein A4U43_C10F6360 [Asparagus officinalis]